MSSYPLSLDLNQKPTQKQTQRLMMTPQMQQAIHLLQLPLMDLMQVVEQEMEQNPVLEYMNEEEEEEGETIKEISAEKELEFNDRQLEILKQLDDEFRDLFAESASFVPRKSSDEDKLRAFLESIIQEEPSLFEHLMKQAREIFLDPEELKMAEVIFGHLDDKGMLTTSLDEIAVCFSMDLQALQKVLKKIQTLDPVGVGSQSVKDILLAQLAAKGLKDSNAYKIVSHHYDDLLHNRLPIIQKSLKIPFKEIKRAIQDEIALLDLHPGGSYSKSSAPTLIPDVRLRQEGDELKVDVNEDPLQPIRLNRKYLRMLDDPALPKETKDFISSKILSAKWLMKNISQRQNTLSRISDYLANYQKEFFMNSAGTLKPLIMKDLADELSLHESTIARAVANKYIETPRGILPFRYFFTNAFTDEKGNDVSSKTVKMLIKEWVSKEDKKRPLSDETISRKLRAQGIPCARRTVAKYRQELKLGNTQQRRDY